MDKLDCEILEALKENARASASEISRRVSLSVPAVSERIRKMEQSGIIEKYTVRVGRKAAGYHLMAFIFVTIATVSRSTFFQEQIVLDPCVLECHAIAGPNDYLLKVLVRDTDELEHFLSHTLKNIDGVVAVNTIIRLSTMKEELNIQQMPL